VAINAMSSARHSHSFIGIDQNGKSSIFTTSGNQATHLILRGGSSGPNYYEEQVEMAEKKIRDSGIEPAVIIDCSHANSGKQHARQARVLRSILDQRKNGRMSIVGFMLESNLVAGAQAIKANPAEMVFGQSVTDECVGWEETVEMLEYCHGML
jgi:3-deoxy-7-phosphoheptulonate synthase